MVIPAGLVEYRNFSDALALMGRHLMAFYDPKEETLDGDSLVRLQRCKLESVLREVRASSPFYQEKLGGVAFDSRVDPLDELPLTSRVELQEEQASHPPFGRFLTQPLQTYCRFHATSGSMGRPLRWLDTREGWAWLKRCWSIVFCGAEVTSHDRILFPFSFGPFIGFWMAFEAAADLGTLVIPGGGMSTKGRIQCVLENEVSVICCTPTYALRMIEVADKEGIDLSSSSVGAVIVAGEPGGNIPSTRCLIESGFGAGVFDHAGMTELGAWGFECSASPGGMHVIESEFIAEVIDSATGAPVADGEPGELVLTNLGRVGCPLIRYRSGDQVRLSRGRCDCGRWFARIDGGILGRVDDMLIIRGNNVFPSAVEGILREFLQVAEFQMEVDESGAMAELRISVEPHACVDAGSLESESLCFEITNRVRDRLNFAPRVVLMDPGTLPRFEMKARRLVRG